MFAILAAFLTAAQPAQAAPAQPPCTPATTQRTTIDRIEVAGTRLDGTCVEVPGVASQFLLHADREALYLYERQRGALAVRSIAIGWPSPAPQAWQPPIAVPVTITGRLSSCPVAGSAGVPMQAGRQACTAGARYAVTAERLTWTFEPEHRMERLVGEDMRARVGSLLEAPADWPYLSRAQTLATELLQRIAQKDRDWLIERFDLDCCGLGYKEGMLGHLLTYPDSPFNELRTGAPAQSVILIAGRVGHPDGSDGVDEALICFCRTSDCTGLWPLRRGDYPGLSRPFACVEFQGASRFCTSHGGCEPWDQVGIGGLYFERSHSYFAEPATSAIHRTYDSSQR